MKYSRGKNPNSKKKRVYKINDNFFEQQNLKNSYYAGFFAADGYIKNNKYLSCMLSIKDKIILENFLKDAESNYKIGKYKSNGFDVCSFTVFSEKMCSDLKNMFNIVPKKSLILQEPNIKNFEFIDSFILGYIDGDGSICLLKNKVLQIQIIGTKEILSWIQNRFGEILNEKLNVIYKEKDKKAFQLVISNKRARKIFLHFYKLNVQKLERKWKKNIFEYCIGFAKKINEKRYFDIFKLYSLGKTQNEIAMELKISQAAVSWFMKRDFFKKLISGEVDLETQESINV
jgi:hypothetical protein